MATIRIRDVPDDAYEVIRQRARACGRSVPAYLRDWMVDLASRPTPDEAWAALQVTPANSGTPGATPESISADLAADRR